MIKAIIFDYGSVLTRGKSLRDFTNVFAPKYGRDVQEFYTVLIDAWRKARVDPVSSESFWKECAKFAGVSASRFRDDFISYGEFRPESLELIKKLKKNYKLGLLSNNIKDWFEENIERYMLGNYFDVILPSYEAQLAKPDIRIYKLMVQKLGVKPEECIFIDDIRKNLPPAEQLGMIAIHFQGFMKLESDLRKLQIRIE